MPRLTNNLADWFPLLETAGVQTPRTSIIGTDRDLSPLLDRVAPDGISGLVEQVVDAAGRLGFPAFLRTGHTAGKHDFARTAFLRSPADALPHIAALVEHSAMADAAGLPTNTWVVREFLPIRPAFVAFRGLPITAERRYFFNALGQVTGHHPYWTPAAVAQGNPRGPRGPLTDEQWRPDPGPSQQGDGRGGCTLDLDDRAGRGGVCLSRFVVGGLPAHRRSGMGCHRHGPVRGLVHLARAPECTVHVASPAADRRRRTVNRPAEMFPLVAVGAVCLPGERGVRWAWAAPGARSAQPSHD